MKKTNDKEIIRIQKFTSFSGKRKVGIDTNVLIKLYEQPFLFNYEESRIFNCMDLMFTHIICFRELVKHIAKKNRDEMIAKKEANIFLNEHNINKIYSKDCWINEEEIKSFEKEVNFKFKEMKMENLECHPPDSLILLAFKKFGINKIWSTDMSFRSGARFLGMDSEGLPSLDYNISKKLREIFNSKNKFRKRH